MRRLEFIQALLVLLLVLVPPDGCSVGATTPDVIIRLTPNSMPRQLEPIDDGSSNNNNSNNTEDDSSVVEVYAKRAVFGSREDVAGQLVHAPLYNQYLCEHFNGERNETVPPYPIPDFPTIMLVRRGQCTFERKAYAAKKYYGAKAILVYDSLSSRYRWNQTSQRVIFPEPLLDYECGQGSGMVTNLNFDPPEYNGTELDPLLDMTLQTNICNLTDGLKPCESKLCVVTSHAPNSTDYPVCCAWDLPVTMENGDDAVNMDTDDIVAVFLTIRQAEIVVQTNLLGGGATISSRSGSSIFNGSYIFMWMLGTLVTVFAAWYAAASYRRFGVKLAAYEARKRAQLDDRRRRSSLVATRGSEIQPPQDVDPDDVETSLEDAAMDAEDAEEDQNAMGLKQNFSNDANHVANSRNDSATPKTTKTKAPRPRWSFPAVSAPRTNQSPSEEKGTEKEAEVWSLHSLPPPVRGKKKQAGVRPSRNNSEVRAALPRNSTSSFTELDDQPVSAPSHRDPDAISNEVVGDESGPPPRESATISAFEMNQWHVLIFVAVASLLLILLFFFQFYSIIFVIYGIGCAGAVSYLVFNPLVVWAIPKLGDSWVDEFNKPVMCRYNGFDVTSQLIAYVWAAIWIWYGLTHYSPERNAFFWLTMDFFGACFCILAMSMLKLNSVKIATLLMVAIFLYDIFFVFITPYLTGGDSVMLTVAGGSESTDDYCFKYPDDRECKGINFLPMLLILPKVNDYANGSVILGLGDVIRKYLPGMHSPSPGVRSMHRR
jgi:hypothetical protein